MKLETELDLGIFCLQSKNPLQLSRCLEGIHYENGRGIASNGKIMIVQYNCGYPPSYEGKTIDPKTNSQFTTYLDWREPLNKALDLMDVPLKIDFAKADKILDDFEKRKMQFPNLGPAVLKLADNYFVSAEQFHLLIIAMRAWQTDTIFLPEEQSPDEPNSQPLACCSQHGCAVLAPVLIKNGQIDRLKKLGLYYEL